MKNTKENIIQLQKEWNNNERRIDGIRVDGNTITGITFQCLKKDCNCNGWETSISHNQSGQIFELTIK